MLVNVKILNIYALHIYYQLAGHIVAGDLKNITGLKINLLSAKRPKFRFPSPIDFTKCCEEIDGALK